MEYLITVFLLIFETVAFYNINSSFMAQNSKNFHKKFFSFLSIICAYKLYIVTGAIFPIPDILCNILLFFLLSYYCFNGIWKIKLLVTTTFIVLLYATDYIVAFFMMLMGITSQEMIAVPALFILVSFLSRLINIIMTFLIKKVFTSVRKNVSLSAKQWLQFFIYSLCSVLTVSLIISYAIDTNTVSYTLIIYTLIVILSNVILFSLINQLEEDNQLQQQNLLLSQQIKLGTESVTSLSESYAKQRSMSHDFKSHLDIIQSFLKRQEYAHAESYAQKISNRVISESNLFNSNNSVVDTLLMQKYLVAKSYDIKMQINIDDLSNLPISTEDLVIVLSNLLDNAIEAAVKCIKERIIKVKIKNEYGSYIFSVHNTASENVVIVNGKIVTTKKDNLNHGYGIKNIKSTLNKYNYDYTITFKNGWFHFSIVMS